MKKILLLLATILSLSVLTSCTNHRSYDDRNIYLSEPVPIRPRGENTSFSGKISSINVNIHNTISIEPSGYLRFKFKPKETGYYHFLLLSTKAKETNIPLFIDFFDEYVDGKTDEGIISSHTGNCLDPEKAGAYAYKKVKANKKIYLRIRAKDYLYMGLSSITIFDKYNSETMVHYHDYTDHFEEINENEYKAYCYCGEYIIKNKE